MPYETPRLLEPDELTRQLCDLPGIGVGASGALTLTVRASTFEEAVQLVRLVAEDAERMDHHPDIDLRWCTVSFALSTHSAGGVTQLDVELAHQILQAAMAVGAIVQPAEQSGPAAASRPFWVQAGLDAGGRLLDETHAPSWWILADPAGQEVRLSIRPSGPPDITPAPQ